MKTSLKIDGLAAISCFLLAFLLVACGPTQPDTTDPVEEEDPNRTVPIEDDPGQRDWPRYRNADFDFSLTHPADWTVLETNPGDPFTIINLYPEDAAAQADFPLNVHGPAGVTYLAVFPEGYGTDLPSGDHIPLAQASDIGSAVGGQWDEDRSQVFRLDDGSVWGVLLRPRQRPDSWYADGYLFAQFAVADFTARCFAKGSDREKPMQQCDPMGGDRVVRSGTVNSDARRKALRALSNWQFGAAEGQEPIGNLLRVTQPAPNSEVGSPLTIEGQARGYWFFEADFPVRLEDYQGNVLTQGVASAAGKWMTEDFVPFAAELRFDVPADERGYLVFERANPSGLPENDRSYRLPVLFPPRSN